jgi:hypothetical protein
MEEVEGVEAWNSPEFLQLSRRQQNVEIFKVKISYCTCFGLFMSSTLIEYQSVCPLIRIGTPPHPLPQGSVSPPEQSDGRDTLACG